MVGEVGTPIVKDIKASTDEELKMLEDEFRALQRSDSDPINERASHGI